MTVNAAFKMGWRDASMGKFQRAHLVTSRSKEAIAYRAGHDAFIDAKTSDLAPDTCDSAYHAYFVENFCQ